MIEKMNEKDFYKWFGKEFQVTRERKGLKQKDVAEQAEVDPTELSRFENTGKKISAYKILRLLKAINSTAEEILGESEKKTYGHYQWRRVNYDEQRREMIAVNSVSVIGGLLPCERAAC